MEEKIKFFFILFIKYIEKNVNNNQVVVETNLKLLIFY